MKYLILTVLLTQATYTISLAQQAKVQIAHLSKGDTTGLASIQKAFKANNPGYDLAYFAATQKVNPQHHTQVVFVQQGGGTATITHAQEAQQQSKVSVGDIILLRKGEKMQADSLLGLLVFTVPQKPDNDLPGFIRPDWDPNITDTPGGCATENNAYRRILLTWKGEVGKYLYHALNAHRVRIMDSFSHYHPADKGFDEFYLVQMVMPGAKIITSEQVDLITEPEKVNKSQVKDLMQEHALHVGDLVYLPRGVVHRGFGGVLAQVITVPGFIPGSEIGVDHHLRKINERLGLQGHEALPYNRKASRFAVIK